MIVRVLLGADHVTTCMACISTAFYSSNQQAERSKLTLLAPICLRAKLNIRITKYFLENKEYTGK